MSDSERFSCVIHSECSGVFPFSEEVEEVEDFGYFVADEGVASPEFAIVIDELVGVFILSADAEVGKVGAFEDGNPDFFECVEGVACVAFHVLAVLLCSLM